MPSYGMKRRLLAAVLLAAVAFAGSCADYLPFLPPEPLKERIEGTYLIVGCVIVEVEGSPVHDLVVHFGYRPFNAPEWALPDHHRVGVDSLGYFALANTPAGEYQLGGIFSLKRDIAIIPRVFGASRGEGALVWLADVGGGYFDPSGPPGALPDTTLQADKSGVIDLGIQVFRISLKNDPSLRKGNWQAWEVDHHGVAALEGVGGTPDAHTRRLSPSEYFSRRYPKSGWTPYLKGKP